MNQVLEVEEVQENKQVNPKWRNVYLVIVPWRSGISSGSIINGTELHNTKEIAEGLAIKWMKIHPGMVEYLGAFPEN